MPPVITPLVFPTSTAGAPRSAASTSRPLRVGATPRGGGPCATTNPSRGVSPALLRGSLVDISRRLQGLNSRHASPVVGRRALSPGPNSGPTVFVETVTRCQAASPPKSVSSVPRSRSPNMSIRKTPSFRSTSSLTNAAASSGRQESQLHSIGVEPITMTDNNGDLNRSRRTGVVTISKAAIVSRTSSFNSSAPSHSATTTRNNNNTTAAVYGGGGVGSRRGSSASLKNPTPSNVAGRTSTVVPSQTLVRVRGSTPRGRPSPQNTPRATSANRWRRGGDEDEVLGTLEGHTKTVDVVAERIVDPKDGCAYIYTTTTITTEPLLHPSSLSQPSRSLSLCRPPSLALLTRHGLHQQNGGSFRYLPSNNGPTLQNGGSASRGTASPVRSNVSTPRNGPSGHSQRGVLSVGVSSSSRPQTPMSSGARRVPLVLVPKNDSPRTRAAMSTSPTRRVPTMTTSAAPISKSPIRIRSSSPPVAARNDAASSPPTAPHRSTSPVLTRGVTAARVERWVSEFEEHLRTEKLPYLEWKKLDVRGKQQMMDKWRVPEMKRRVILEC